MTESQYPGTINPERTGKKGKLRMIRPVWWGLAFMALATYILTLILPTFDLYVFDTILLACMGAIALQVILGTAGLVSVGNSAFLLVGAFAAVFALRSGIAFPFDVGFATVVSGVAGFIVGLPAIRLRLLFLALATLAAYYLAVFLGNYYQLQVPDASSIGFVIPTMFNGEGFEGAGRAWAWMLFGCLAVIILGASRVMRERSGRALRMIRDHEHIAPTLGISVVRYKLTIFVLSSMVIGFEGALTAHFSGIVSTASFSVTLSFQYLAMIVIGGLDSIAGAVIGAVIVVGMPAWLPSVVSTFVGSSRATTLGPNISLIVYGVLVIVFVTASPDGMVGLLRTIRRLTMSWWARRWLPNRDSNATQKVD